MTEQRLQTDPDKKPDRLRSMMRPHEGAHHSVVAFGLRGAAAGFLHSGIHFEDTPPEDVIFEIGSITKVFTGVLLCHSIEVGTVDPCAPLAEMSEDLADVPAELTPERLISHTSGLPCIHMPIWRAAITPMPQGPYAGFARADLLRWLRTWKAKPDPALIGARSCMLFRMRIAGAVRIGDLTGSRDLPLRRSDLRVRPPWRTGTCCAMLWLDVVETEPEIARYSPRERRNSGLDLCALHLSGAA